MRLGKRRGMETAGTKRLLKKLEKLETSVLPPIQKAIATSSGYFLNVASLRMLPETALINSSTTSLNGARTFCF